jgi:hypothetical protein
MFNGFKARIRKLAELTHTEFCKLLQWGNPIGCDNPQALICSASSGGEVVAFAVAEPCIVFGSYALKPGANADDLHRAGEAIEEAIAQQTSFGRMLFELPDGAPTPPGMKVVRFVEKQMPKTTKQPSCALKDSTDEAEATLETWVN